LTTTPVDTTTSTTASGNNPCSSCWPNCPQPLCDAECSDTWWQCWNGGGVQKPVPGGTKCKGNEFVHAYECSTRRLSSTEVELSPAIHI
jgi:hypothetical protein